MKNELRENELLNNFIIKGEALIYPDNKKRWCEYILNMYYNNKDWDKIINDAILLMMALEEGYSLEDVIYIMAKQNRCRTILEEVRYLVFDFSKRGPEFYLATSLNKTTELLNLIDKKVLENQGLEFRRKLSDRQK